MIGNVQHVQLQLTEKAYSTSVQPGDGGECIVIVSLVVQIMKSETSRISHEQQAMKEKVKVSMFPAGVCVTV